MRIIFSGVLVSLVALLSACQGIQKETPAAVGKNPTGVNTKETNVCNKERLTFREALQKLQGDTITKEDGVKFINTRQSLDDCDVSHNNSNSGAAPDLKKILSEGGVKTGAP